MEIYRCFYNLDLQEVFQTTIKKKLNNAKYYCEKVCENI